MRLPSGVRPPSRSARQPAAAATNGPRTSRRTSTLRSPANSSSSQTWPTAMSAWTVAAADSHAAARADARCTETVNRQATTTTAISSAAARNPPSWRLIEVTSAASSHALPSCASASPAASAAGLRRAHCTRAQWALRLRPGDRAEPRPRVQRTWARPTEAGRAGPAEDGRLHVWVPFGRHRMSLLPRAAMSAHSTTVGAVLAAVDRPGRMPRLLRGRFARPHIAAALFLTLAVGLVLQIAHAGQHEGHEIPPVLHWLRDSLMAMPLALPALWAVHPVAGRAARRAGRRPSSAFGLAVGAVAGALLFAVGSVPGSIVHSPLFDAHHAGMGFVQHALFESQIVFAAAFATLMGLGLLGRLPGPATWQRVDLDARVDGRRVPARWWLGVGATLALFDIAVLHHVYGAAAYQVAPALQWIIDALPAVPLGALTMWALTRGGVLARMANTGAVTARVVWAGAGAALFALAGVPGG